MYSYHNIKSPMILYLFQEFKEAFGIIDADKEQIFQQHYTKSIAFEAQSRYLSFFLLKFSFLVQEQIPINNVPISDDTWASAPIGAMEV